MAGTIAYLTALVVALVGIFFAIPPQFLPASLPVSVTVSWSPLVQHLNARSASLPSTGSSTVDSQPPAPQPLESADPSGAAAAGTPAGLGTDNIKILSYEPFIAHIGEFVTPAERAHLMELAAPLLGASMVVAENGSLVPDLARTSSTAFLPPSDPVVATLIKRAADFQGFLPHEYVDIQVTSYQQGQQYRPHYDWFEPPVEGKNRLSTFFAILEADCSECGTQFPDLKVDWSRRDERWCEAVDCNKDVLTTKNIEGGAVFWRNLDNKGAGRRDVVHAGLPAEGGTKVGLNIWTTIPISEFSAARDEHRYVLQP